LNTVPLGSVSQINPKKPRDLDPDTLCSFVPMEYVDDHFGTITETDTRRIKQVEKGHTYFHNWDVLFAKITPCMENGKCAIARNLVNELGFGSTEFHVVRPKHDVMPEWIFYFLRQHSTRQEAARHMTGTAGQQRVPTRFLQEVMIPLPPLPEQKRIADILAKVDRLRRLRHTARDLSDSYLQSVFLEMFGDPVSNPRGWQVKTLSALRTKLSYGTSAKCYSEIMGLPVLRIPNVVSREIDLEDLKYAELPDKEVTKLTLRKGDLLFVRTNGNPDYVGRCAVFDLDARFLFASYLIRARLNLQAINPWFLATYLRLPAGRQAMAPYIRTTAGQSNIGMEGLGQIPVLLPPLPQQQEFAHTVHKFERLRAHQREALRQAEHLFQTLLHRAFRGELEDPKGLGDP
jgi:type I restriction enzyme S subunit